MSIRCTEGDQASGKRALLGYGDAVACGWITGNDPAIAELLEGMRSVGEGFVFGCAEPVTFLKTIGVVMGQVVFGQQLPGSVDHGLSSYHFLVVPIIR